MRLYPLVGSTLIGAGALAVSCPASADPLRLHLEAGGAHALGDPQGSDYGFGVQGALAAELPLGRAVGLQLEGGGLWLPSAGQSSGPGVAPHGDGTALTAMGGVRVRPFTVVAGPWADANIGYVRTGDLDRFGVDFHVGYDWRVGEGRWDIGPYVGYFELVEPGGALRPEDAHVLSLGIHIALGAEFPAPPPAPPPPPPPPPPDRDHDSVVDADDACPDVPGVHTDDPKTNGCPPDRDHDSVVDADDACPDVPGVHTDDPKTNGCPPDRDQDGVVDADDACPDVPGVHTSDPKTNGCPPPAEKVRVVEDHIDYDDVILFDTDSPHVHHSSWAVIEKLAKFIIANPDIQEVNILGHADERGSEEHNQQLSEWRAQAVKKLLVHFGVEDKRLTTVGYGKTKPKAGGHNEGDWRQNRRVEFIITKVRNVSGGSTVLSPPATDAPSPTPGGPP